MVLLGWNEVERRASERVHCFDVAQCAPVKLNLGNRWQGGGPRGLWWLLWNTRAGQLLIITEYTAIPQLSVHTFSPSTSDPRITIKLIFHSSRWALIKKFHKAGDFLFLFFFFPWCLSELSKLKERKIIDVIFHLRAFYKSNTVLQQAAAVICFIPRKHTASLPLSGNSKLLSELRRYGTLVSSGLLGCPLVTTYLPASLWRRGWQSCKGYWGLETWVEIKKTPQQWWTECPGYLTKQGIFPTAGFIPTTRKTTQACAITSVYCRKKFLLISDRPQWIWGIQWWSESGAEYYWYMLPITFMTEGCKNKLQYVLAPKQTDFYCETKPYLKVLLNIHQRLAVHQCFFSRYNDCFNPQKHLIFRLDFQDGLIKGDHRSY